MLISEVVRSTRLRMGIERLMQAAQEMSEWKDWYQRHEPLIEELFGDDAKLFKALLAATSQRASIYTNVPLALKAYQQIKRGEPFVGFMPQVVMNLERLRGEQALFGRKISQFGGAMDNQANQVAVDQHIGELFFGTRKPGPTQVRKAKQVITQIAQKLGWQPREVQAALWAYNKSVRSEEPETVYTYHTVLNNRREEINLIRQALAAIKQPQAA